MHLPGWLLTARELSAQKAGIRRCCMQSYVLSETLPDRLPALAGHRQGRAAPCGQPDLAGHPQRHRLPPPDAARQGAGAPLIALFGTHSWQSPLLWTLQKAGSSVIAVEGTGVMCMPM